MPLACLTTASSNRRASWVGTNEWLDLQANRQISVVYWWADSWKVCLLYTSLIAQLLGLFLTFLGEATTLRLIEDLRLQADIRTVSATSPADTTDSAADGPAMAAGFENLLLEIDRLRKVSERIETLAEKLSLIHI